MLVSFNAQFNQICALICCTICDMDKCAVFVAYYKPRGLERYYNLMFAGRKISRNSIRSGYYFRGRKISRKIQIREYSENFLHAKNVCYTGVCQSQYLFPCKIGLVFKQSYPIRSFYVELPGLCILNHFSDLFFAFKDTMTRHFAGYAPVALEAIWLHEQRDLIFLGPLMTLPLHK